MSEHFSTAHRARKVRLRNIRRTLPALAIMLEGCGHAPEFNILGSYFPAWLLCIAVGTLLSGLSFAGLRRFGLEREIVASIVVYPCLAIFFACTLWLLLFR
jgi:hypothetical protein